MIARFLAPLIAAVTSGSAIANPPIVVVQKPSPSTVVSPLTPPSSQSGQQLLNQVQSTLNQRRMNHQLSTIQATLRSRPATVTPAVVVQPR